MLPSSSEGGQASFSSRHNQPHVPPFPPHPMYFAYPHPMATSIFTNTGSGDNRSQMGISSHPFFTHLPRLGYSSHAPPAPPLHHMEGGGGGPYPRPGRPWWTVPPFPPPSHLHHPHHNHPPPDDNYTEPVSIQDHHPSSHNTPPITSSAQTTTTSIPRTSSRNAYSQQRLSILKKHQQQKEQASKIKDQENGVNLKKDIVSSSIVTGMKTVDSDVSPSTKMRMIKSKPERTCQNKEEMMATSLPSNSKISPDQ